MRFLAMTVGLVLMMGNAGVARAGTTADWGPSIEFNLSPTLGKEVRGSDAGADRDYSEYEVKLAAKREAAIFGNDLNLVGHVVYDPDQFGDEVESHLQFDAVIGKQRYLARRGRLFSRDVKPTDNAWQPWAQISLSQVWDGVFAGADHFDVSLLGGIVYTNVPYRVRSIGSDGKPVFDKGLYFTASATVERLTSTQKSISRWSPRLSATVYGKLREKAFRPFVRTDYEVRFFDLPASGMIDDRLDYRLKVTAGIDIAPWLGGPVDAFEIAGLYFRRWSNAPNGDFERGYFAPSLTLSKSF